jgi:hypothetical protein
MKKYLIFIIVGLVLIGAIVVVWRKAKINLVRENPSYYEQSE